MNAIEFVLTVLLPLIAGGIVYAETKVFELALMIWLIFIGHSVLLLIRWRK